RSATPGEDNTRSFLVRAATIHGHPGDNLAGLGFGHQLIHVHHQLSPVERRPLDARPGVVHGDGVEVAHLDANIAAHAAAVVDPERIDDLATLGFSGFLLGVV